MVDDGHRVKEGLAMTTSAVRQQHIPVSEPCSGATATGCSGGEQVCDHARLVERLADTIWRLRLARLLAPEHVHEVRACLESLLVDELIPSVQEEERALHAGDCDQHPFRISVSREQWRRRRQSREHRHLIEAVHEVQYSRTTMQALTRAEEVRALLHAHLVREDHALVATDSARMPGRYDGEALNGELDELLVHDHARITAAIAAARAASALRSEEELGSYDRAVAALSHHAVMMSTRAYPMIRDADPDLERSDTQVLTSDLRNAERALSQLNQVLRGAPGSDASVQHRLRLWDGVEQFWQDHIAEEERLVRHAAPLLGPERVVDLVALLRRPGGHSLTRVHPRLLGGGWPTRTTVRAQSRIDRWRDEMDSRSPWC